LLGLWGQRTKAVWWSEDLITKTIFGGAIFMDEALALEMLPLPTDQEDFMAVGFTNNGDQSRVFDDSDRGRIRSCSIVSASSAEIVQIDLGIGFYYHWNP
jgi:hypothetical protein